MISWSRILYPLGLAVVEATPAALLLTMVGGGGWVLLIGVVLAGALADWIVLRRISPRWQGPALVTAGALLALWAVKVQVGDGYSPLAGWGQALGTLFSAHDPNTGIAYLTFLAALYVFWRGTRLTTHDSVSLHWLFRRTAVGIMAIIGVGFLGASPDPEIGARAVVQIMGFFAVGLITIALATASEEHEVQLRRLGWRGMLTLGGAVVLVLVAGLVFASLFGNEAAQVIRSIWSGIVLIVVLLFAPLFFLIFAIIERLLIFIHLERLLQRPALFDQQQQQPPLATDTPGIFPPWVDTALRLFFALLPILLIVGLMLLARHRLRRKAGDDEERESLWSWGNMLNDLRDLFGGLRNPFGHAAGLRDVLASLRGGDPVSRIRRSYIRLLLAGEAHEQPRAAPQTPREYAATAGAIVPGIGHSVGTLTEAYERARYFPAGATDTDAEAAERAWNEIEAAEQRTK
jgi:hypothetical protein